MILINGIEELTELLVRDLGPKMLHVRLLDLLSGQFPIVILVQSFENIGKAVAFLLVQYLGSN